MFTRQQAVEKLIEFKYANYLTTVDCSLKAIAPHAQLLDSVKTQLYESATEYVNNLVDLEQQIDQMLILLNENLSTE